MLALPATLLLMSLSASAYSSKNISTNRGFNPYGYELSSSHLRLQAHDQRNVPHVLIVSLTRSRADTLEIARATTDSVNVLLDGQGLTV